MRADVLYDQLFEAGFQPEIVEEDTEIIICCPFCQDDRPRLYVSVEHGGWTCFHCSEEGGVHKLLMEALDLSGGQAFEIERKLFPVGDTPFDDDALPISRASSFKPIVDPNKVLHLPRQMESFKDTWDMAYRDLFASYLEARGVTLDVAERMGIGYARSGRYANRVIIPVWNGEVLCTFIARTILHDCPNCERPLNDCTCRPYKFPKVLTPSNADGAQARGTLFNIDAVAASKPRRVAVVEGVFDALKHPHAVALLGAGHSKAQLAQLIALSRAGTEIVLALDPDTAGYKGMFKLAKALASELVTVRVALLPEGTDPGEMDTNAFKRHLDDAPRFSL